MRTIIVAVGIMLFNAAGSAQGTLQFNNRVAGLVDAPISYRSGEGVGAGVTAELVRVGPAGETTVLLPRTTFRTTSAAAAYYVVPVDVVVPDVPPGEAVTVRLRAYLSIFSSYEAAVESGGPGGQSNDVIVSPLGGIDPNGGPLIPPPALVGLRGFVGPIVPEPSSIALAVLGTVALIIRWRRN